VASTIRVLVVAAVVASVAGCVSMPNSGPPGSFSAVQGDTEQNQDYIGPIAAPPGPGWSPRDIVSGFLAASASYYTDTALARAYLLPSTSRTWNPDSVVVLSNDTAVSQQPSQAGKHGGQQAVLTVTGELQATLNGSGQYLSPAPAVESGQFTLVKSDGQWRIWKLPPYLLLTQSDFQRVYQPQDLYFFDSSHQVLVPDPVFEPKGTSAAALASELVSALIAGPGSWLADATDTQLPKGTTVHVAVDDTTATVNLGGAIASAGTKVLALVSAQLIWTLTGVPTSQSYIQSVVLEINGKQFLPGSGGSAGTNQNPAQNKSMYQEYNPYPLAPAGFYYVDDRGQAFSRCGSEQAAQDGSVGSAVLVFGHAGAGGSQHCGQVRSAAQSAQGRPPLSMVAVSPDGKYVAGVSPDKNTVYVSALAGAANPAFFRQLNEPGVTAITWDREDDLWIAQSDSISMLPPYGRVAPVLFQGQVTGMSIAPDGVRIAVIVQPQGSSQPELELAAIRTGQTGSGPPEPQVGQPYGEEATIDQGVPLGPDITDPVALTWYDADDLMVLDRGVAGNVLEEVPVDGQKATTLSVPSDAVSITADNTANVLVVGLSTGELEFSAGLDGAWQAISSGVGQNPAYPGPLVPSG
jgi:Lipoprotein LpqB beta-propeller domain/Sporulation and spore germination